MPVTAARLNLVKGLGPVLQIAEGYTVEIPEEIHDVLDGRTDPTWPTTWFVPNITGEGAFQDVYTVMNNWGANHCVISYGHIGGDLITLASMLRIPVNMHNVRRRTYSDRVHGACSVQKIQKQQIIVPAKTLVHYIINVKSPLIICRGYYRVYFSHWNESVRFVVLTRIISNRKLLNIRIHTIFVSEIIEQ